MRLVKTSILLLLLLIISFPSAFAGNENQPAGARRISLGSAYMGVRGDFWQMWGNPAGIAGVKDMETGGFIERRFLLNKLNFGTAGFVMPFKEKHYAGLALSGFGFGSYKERTIGLTYATTIASRLSLGAQLNYTNTSILNYGATGAIVVSAGILAEISKGLTLGFRVYNANQANIRRGVAEEKIPTTLDLGVAYQVSDKVLLVADLEKQVNFPASFRGGIEYAFMKNFKARVGTTTQPVSLTAGIGFSAKALEIDLSNSFHETLGYTPSISLNYKFKSKAKAK
ncbi:MAG TPA: hypothetical protein ENJ82_07710 [Bacteroidetes bacterium]|nr:hypothetical protein [Bacteroidota bacterium]